MLANHSKFIKRPVVSSAPSLTLWSGRLAGVADPHLDLQLVRGFLPYHQRGGTCKVRGGGTNLWYAAAKTLGFKATIINCLNRLFVSQVASLCTGVKALVHLPGQFCWPSHLPDILFLDVSGFRTGLRVAENWDAWQTPHLFYDLWGSMTASPRLAGLRLAHFLGLDGWSGRPFPPPRMDRLISLPCSC
jgi:hypothetical protein